MQRDASIETLRWQERRGSRGWTWVSGYGPVPSRADHHPATASAMTITTSKAHRARSPQPERGLQCPAPAPCAAAQIGGTMAG
jgi:hypothetical protein